MHMQKFVVMFLSVISLLLAEPSMAFTGVLVKLLGKVEHAIPETEVTKLARQITEAGDLTKVVIVGWALPTLFGLSS